MLRRGGETQHRQKQGGGNVGARRCRRLLAVEEPGLYISRRSSLTSSCCCCGLNRQPQKPKRLMTDAIMGDANVYIEPVHACLDTGRRSATYVPSSANVKRVLVRAGEDSVFDASTGRRTPNIGGEHQTSSEARRWQCRCPSVPMATMARFEKPVRNSDVGGEAVGDG